MSNSLLEMAAFYARGGLTLTKVLQHTACSYIKNLRYIAALSAFELNDPGLRPISTSFSVGLFSKLFKLKSLNSLLL